MSGLLLGFYMVLMILVAIGWSGRNNRRKLNSPCNGVSILIPFRNEEENLPILLKALKDQNTNTPFEVLLINDHSTDDYKAVLHPHLTNCSTVRLIELQEDTGKKAAISKGVDASKYDIILQCDADVIPGVDWIDAMTCELTDEDALVCGPIQINNTGKWSWFNQIETIMLQAITAAGIYWKFPLMANGANLLYRRSDYLAYRSAQWGSKYQSGDDQFLMEFIQKEGRGIRYCKNQSAIVLTSFSDHWNEMVEQRARWAGKNKRSNGLKTLINFFLAGIQVYFIFLLFGTVYDTHYFWLVLNFFFLKSLSEGLVVLFASSFFSFNSLRLIPLFALYYPLFIIQVGIKSLAGTYSWKGRIIRE